MFTDDLRKSGRKSATIPLGKP